MRKPAFAYVKTKAQIRCAVTLQMVSAFVFPIRKFMPLAIFCGCTAELVSDLVKKNEDRFSDGAAHLQYVLWRKKQNYSKAIRL